MPEHSQSTADTAPAVVTPPPVTPNTWQVCPVFREAFLMYLTDEPLNSVLRIIGRALFDLIPQLSPLARMAGGMSPPPSCAPRWAICATCKATSQGWARNRRKRRSQARRRLYPFSPHVRPGSLPVSRMRSRWRSIPRSER